MAKSYHIPGIGVFSDGESGKSYHLPGGVFNEASGISAALTGTVTASITESDIVTGGKTIILTLTGDTWIAAGTGPIGTTAQSDALLAGIDSAQAEATGWDAVVKANFVASTDLVRTSDTVATITIGAEATYDITAQETITATIPAAVLTTSSSPVVATPTFTVDIVSGFQPAWCLTGRRSNIIGAR